MTLWQNGVLRYGHFGKFLEFFWDRMANLGLIDFKLGLYIKVNEMLLLQLMSLLSEERGGCPTSTDAVIVCQVGHI